MMESMLHIGDQVVVQRQHLQQLLEVLKGMGYQVIGPTRRDGAVVYEEVDEVEDLPAGWTDTQDGGVYRLHKRDDDALFGYTAAPQAWKKFLHPPRRRLWEARRDQKSGDFVFVEDAAEIQPRAFIGVRSCEIHAMAIQNTVFTSGPYIDPLYKALYESTFIVAVNCGHAGGTCFCDSMHTGPKATFGYDLAMTEIIEPDRHVFLVEVGTQRGADVMEEVPYEAASSAERTTAQQIVAETARNMGRTMNTTNIKEFLYANYNHAQWDDVASRCLSCANCTAVCPTCFCMTTEDVTDLTGDSSERWQRWDSCFTMDFSYIHGGSVRASSKARYRQWMTHKLATWIDQFGTSGCVGCGRCITWCPVGIDITAEVDAIHDSDAASKRAEISTLNMV